MRGFKAFFLLSILIAHLMCGMLFFSTLRHSIRSTRVQRISESERKDLSAFTFTREEFAKHSEKEGEELLINNIYYDIKTIKETDGKLIITAVADGKESDLVKKFTALFHQQHENDSNRISPFNFSYEYLFSVHLDIFSPFKEVSANCSHYRFNYYPSLFHLLLSPPPEIA